MFTALLEAAVRGAILLAVVWVLLQALRVRDPAVEKNTWTLLAAATLGMPLLSWIISLVTPPLRMAPLSLVPSSPVAATGALMGIAPGGSGSRLELACALLYAIVAALLLMRFLTGLWIGLRLRRRASIAPALQVRHMDVRVSDAIRSPASFASTILLPLGYESWDSATLDTVLAHEQAHVANRDCYRLWLAALYRAVFWFDPLAHWLHWRLRALSELTSDEAAAAVAGDRAAYAATLRQMASAPEFIPSTVAMADSPSLGRRLRRLVSEQGLCPPLARGCRALLTSAVLVMVVLAAAPWAGAVVPAAQRPATLEFHLVDEQNSPVQAQRSGEVPSGDELYKAQDGAPILLKRDAIATSDEITRVAVQMTKYGTAVSVRLDPRGAASMLSATRKNIGHQMAAVYNGRVINHAVIRGAFGRQFQITGLTAAQSHDLAMKFSRVR
ncbi:MAG: SecDF P1 head subdomain-containing protein [Steroidobacteraceae bacterium]